MRVERIRDERRRLLSGILALVCFCMAVLPFFETTSIESRAATFTGQNIWSGSSETMFGHSRNYLYRWSDGYQMTFCISPGKHMGTAVQAGATRTTIEDETYPYIKSQEDYLILAKLCTWFDLNASIWTDNATYAAVQTAVWAVMDAGWESADGLELVVDKHVPGTYSRWQEIKAYVNETPRKRPEWLETSAYLAKKSPHGMELKDGVWVAEMDISAYPQLATPSWMFVVESAGWNIEFAGDKIRFTYSGGQESEALAAFRLPLDMLDWGRNTATLTFYIPEGDPSRIQAMISSGPYDQNLYLHLSTSGAPARQEESGQVPEVTIYEHRETFESHYRVELDKICAETGKPLAGAGFQVLEAFDSGRAAGIDTECMTPRPSAWQNFKVCADEMTDADGRITHEDAKKYEYVRTYCGGHPEPQYVEDDGTQGEDASEAIAAENALLQEQWQAQVDACAESTDFHDEIPGEGLRKMLEDRQAVYDAFIGLEYDYTFREIEARYGYMRHGQHRDDEPIPVLRVSSAESGGNARVVEREVVVDESVGYINNNNVGDNNNIFANTDKKVGFITQEILIQKLEAAGRKRTQRIFRTAATPSDADSGDEYTLQVDTATSSDASDVNDGLIYLPKLKKTAFLREMAADVSLPEPIPDDEPWLEPLADSGEPAYTFSVSDHRTEGEIHFNKRDMQLEEGETDGYDSYGDTQGDATLEGAVYGLYAAEDIVHPDGVTGVVYHAGELTAVASTDKNGDGSFMAYTEESATSREALNLAGTWVGHPLIMGNYVIMEITRSEGYELTVPDKLPEFSGRADVTTPMCHPIDMHDGSWLEFDVAYAGTVDGFDLLVSGYPEGAEFYRSGMETVLEKNKVWVGSELVETGEYEKASAGEYRLDAQDRRIPRRDAQGNILYDTTKPVLRTYPVTRRLNYYPSGSVQTVTDPEKWADTSAVDPVYVAEEANAVLKQMGYKQLEPPDDENAPWSRIPLDGSTNQELVQSIREWFVENTFWDSGKVSRVWEEAGSWYALVLHDYVQSQASAVYETLSGKLYVRISVQTAEAGERHMYVPYDSADYIMEKGYATVPSIRQKDQAIPFGEPMENYIGPEYEAFYEQYMEGEYRLDGQGQKIPVYEWKDIYEMRDEARSDYRLTPLEAEYDPISRSYRIHVDTKKEWDPSEQAATETFRAVTKEKSIIWNGKEMFYSDYLVNEAGVGVSAYAAPGSRNLTGCCLVGLTYPGQISPAQDGCGTPGFGTRIAPAAVQEKGIKQAIKVIKDIYTDGEKTQKLDNFRFKAYLKSNLQRLFRKDDGTVVWLDRRGNPVDIHAYLKVYPGLVPDIFTKVPMNSDILARQPADAVIANKRLYEEGAAEPNSGYTAVLETIEQEVKTEDGVRIVKAFNYSKFFDAVTVANWDRWDDASPEHTSHRPLGNAVNRSEAAEENVKASDLVRQFAIDWYLDGEVEMLKKEETALQTAASYSDQFYDEALRRAIQKADNYLKPFFLYDLDEIYAVSWDTAPDGGSDRDKTTLAANEEADAYYFGISANLPYGTYVIAEQQPHYVSLLDYQNRYYQIDGAREVTVPSVYLYAENAGDFGEAADSLSEAYLYDSRMTMEEMTERYKIRFGEENRIETAHSDSGDFELLPYGLELDQIENGTAEAEGDAHFALTQDAWKPYMNYYNDQDDRTAAPVTYYLSGNMDGKDKTAQVYRYSSVSEAAGLADDVCFSSGEPEGGAQLPQYRDRIAVMIGMQTAYDGLYSAALVPWSLENGDAAGRSSLLSDGYPGVSEGKLRGSISGDGSFARVRFHNTPYGARLRIEKLDSDTHENLLHDDAIFNIYRASRDESADGDGAILFYEEDTPVTGSREFLEAMGAERILPMGEGVYTGTVRAGTPVCCEEDQVFQTDLYGIQTGNFRSFTTARDGIMEAAEADSGNDSEFGRQNTGYLETPQPLPAGVYVLAERKAPSGYVRSKPIAVEIYSDRVTYYQRGEKDNRVTATVYDSLPQTALEDSAARKYQDMARIYVEDTPTRLVVEKKKEAAGEERTTVTFQISGRVDGTLAEIGGNPNYEYAYQNGTYMGYAWKKGTLEYLAALKEAGEDVEIVYHGSLFAGYGYVTRPLETADDANSYVAGALMTLYEGIELHPSGDSQDAAYGGLNVERSGAGNVTRMYVEKEFAGTRTEFMQVQENGSSVWSAETVQRPDTDILFYDLGGLELFRTEIIEGKKRTFAYGRNHEKLELEQMEEDKQHIDRTDGGYSIFAFQGGKAVLELEGGDFTKISYSAADKVLEGAFARPIRLPDGSAQMSEGVKVYHLDTDGNRDSLVDPYTGMAYAVTGEEDGAAVRVFVWPVKIAYDEAGHVMARDKISTSRIATFGDKEEETYLTGTWRSDEGEQSHAMKSLVQNRFGQNMNGEALLQENSGDFEKTMEPVYDEHGMAVYYRRSDETYETETELYDRSGRAVRTKESDLTDAYDKASYEIGEEPVWHRQGEGYILENTWVTGEAAPDDPFSNKLTAGQADLLRRVPVGIYIMEELAAPEGYLKGLPIGVAVEETSLVQKVGLTDVTTKLLISKVDGTEEYSVPVLNMGQTDIYGEPLRLGTVTEGKSSYGQRQMAGVRLALFEAERVYTSDLKTHPAGTYLRKKSGTPLCYLSTDSRAGAVKELTAEWTTTDTPLYLEGIPAGEYLLEEIDVPEGFVSAPAKEISIKQTQQVQQYTLYNDHTKIEIEKYAAEAGSSHLVNGAGFTIYEAMVDSQNQVVYDDDGNPVYDSSRPMEHFVTDDGEKYAGFMEAFEEQYRRYGTKVRAVSWEYGGRSFTASYVSHTQIDAAAAGGGSSDFPTSAEIIFQTEDGKEIRTVVYGQKTSLQGRDFLFEYRFDCHALTEINERALSYLTVDGMRRLDYLPVGRAYVLVETEAPAGYAASAPVLVTAQDTGDILRYRVENEEGRLVISKTAESLEGKELAGAKLALYRADEAGELVQEDAYLAAMWISGQDGVYTQEDQVNGKIPRGYAAGDKKPHTLKRLPEGVYWLVELECPDYYTTFQPMRIDYHMEDQIRILRVSDAPAEGEVTVYKTDTEGQPLSGAVFEVSAYRQPDFSAPVFTRCFSDSEGTAVLRGLPVGEVQGDGSILPYCYRLRELVPPAGYAVNPQIFSFEFDPDRDGVSYAWGESARWEQSVANQKTRVVLEKKDFNDVWVGGAELMVCQVKGTDASGKYLYDAENSLDRWITSAETPNHVLEGLTAGFTYLLLETKAPQGYRLMEPVAFTLSEDGRRICFISNGMSSITIHDLYTAALRNRYAVRTEIEVTDGGGNHVASWTASGGGHGLTAADGIQNGESYTWTERTFYSDGSAEITDRLTKRARLETREQAEENTEGEQGICWVSNRRPERVHVRLSRIDGSEVASYDPTEDMPELQVGNAASEEELFANRRQYILTETTSYSDGSLVESGRMAFEIGDDGTICAIVGYDAARQVLVSKTDITGQEEIPGASLQIVDENGQVVEAWISGETAHMVEAQLEPGQTYRLQEVLPPAGYAWASEILFSVAEDGTVDRVTMEDAVTHVSVTKTDITGEEELEGARLQVLDQDGTVIEEWTSGKHAHEMEGKLTAGQTYTLHEEAAPAGYAYAADIEFTVSLDGSIDTVVMKDEEIPIRPTRPGQPYYVPEKPKNIEPGTVQAEYQTYLIGMDGVPLGGLRYYQAPATGDIRWSFVRAALFLLGLSAAVCIGLGFLMAEDARGKRQRKKCQSCAVRDFAKQDGGSAEEKEGCG